MALNKSILIICLGIAGCLNVWAQQPQDTIAPAVHPLTAETDTIYPSETIAQLVADSIPLDTTTNKKFIPNSKMSMLFAIFPGGGQIYNRKYWKLPIVYGGFLGCYYAIRWNGTQYTGYKNAYRDITDDDPNTNSWHNYVPYYVDPNNWSDAEKTNFATRMKSRKDYFRRYRDMSILIVVGVYALSFLDAYVDSQLSSFDMSDDLSFKMQPVIFDASPTQRRSLGLQCSITF